MEQIQEQRSGLLDGTAVEAIVNQVSDAVGFITQSEAHIQEAITDHLQRGALRSGQGSHQASHERIKTFEESEKLIDIEEKKEIVTDTEIAVKLYERF